MEIKDLAGISEPLKRLIEVVAEGIGGVSRPILTRKNADAKAYEIKTISEAVVDSQKLLGPIKYDTDTVTIASEANKLPEASPEDRINSRLTYQEAKRQSNVEHITQYAAEELEEAEDIGNERPDSDWTSRFFRIAEDITTDEMQALWGKVLAGEVKQPGSYSLRTLDILKNISKNEAETFVRVAQISVSSGGQIFIPNPDRGTFLKDHFSIGFLDLLLLREIGLLAPNDLEFSLSPATKNSQTIFTCGSTCIIIEVPSGTPKLPVTSIVFSEIGKQLCQLVDKLPADQEYIKKIAAPFQHPGVVAKAGTIAARFGDQLQCVGLSEVAGNKPKPEEKK